MKDRKVASGSRVLAVLFGLLALVSTAADFTVNGLTYSNSEPIVPGEWTCLFSKAKTYADNKNIPLVVVWANPGCGFCNSLESGLGKNGDFNAWRKARGYVMVFEYGKTTNAKYGMNASDGALAYNYAYTLTTRLDAYPFVAVHWKKGPNGKAVNKNFVGRSGRMPVTAPLSLMSR